MIKIIIIINTFFKFIPSGVKIPRVKTKLKVNEKLKWSRLVARETVVEQDRVEGLNSDRNALEKKAGNRRYLAAQLRKESNR